MSNQVRVGGWRLAVAVVAAALTSVAAAFFAYSQWTKSPANPQASLQLFVDERSLDFGEAWETDRFVWHVPIFNPGPEPVRVSTVAPSCNCVTASSVSEVIPPGASRDVPFEIDLRKRCAGVEPAAVREDKFPLAVVVEPASATPHSPWVIRGRVKTALTVSVGTVDFGRLPTNSIPKPRVISVRALTGLSHLEVKKGSDSLTAAIIPTADPARWDLIVGGVAQLAVGRYVTEVNLCPVTRSGEFPPPVRIPVEFDILGDVQPDSSTVVLGNCRVGELTEGRLTLTSLSYRPFRVASLSANPPDFVEIVLNETGETSLSFLIRHRVKEVGDKTGIVRFGGQDADEKPFEVMVEVRCFGTGTQ